MYGEFIFKSLQGVKGRKVKAFVHLLNLNCNIIMVRAIEHFSIESHKTKTRVITTAIGRIENTFKRPQSKSDQTS